MISGRRAGAAALKALLLTLFLVFAVAPLLWIIITSLKSPREIYTFPLLYFPSRPSLDSYRKLFSFARFGLYFRNSILVSLLASAGALLVCMLSGYTLSRFRYRRARNTILLGLYFTQMVPGFLLMAPLFVMLSRLRLTNSLVILAVVYVAMVVAFGTIMARSFFDRIPSALDEAALIDGCTAVQALFRIVLPVTLPAMIAIFSFSFVNIWNELFVAVILLSSESRMTVPVTLNSFISKAGISWDVMSAGIVVALLPTMVVFGVGQRYIIAGLTEGSVKG